MCSKYFKLTFTVLTIDVHQLLPMPTTTNNHVAKAYRSLARAYDALAEIFQSGDAVKLRAEVEVGQQIWHNVRQVPFYMIQLSAVFSFF